MIVPDDEDWTWVLHRPCPECGVDAGAVDPSRVGAMVLSDAAGPAGAASPTDADGPVAAGQR